MTSAMESLYQEVILDLSRHPHGRGLEGNADGESHQVNPTCGDEVTLELHLEPGTDRICSVKWDGHGCAISQASASLSPTSRPASRPHSSGNASRRSAPRCGRAAPLSRTRNCSATRSPSEECPVMSPGSNARCSPGSPAKRPSP